MITRELIAKLQAVDPAGTCEVMYPWMDGYAKANRVLGGSVFMTAETLPWDAEDLRGPSTERTATTVVIVGQ